MQTSNTLNRPTDGQIPHLMAILNQFRETNAMAEDKICSIKEKLTTIFKWQESINPPTHLRENDGSAIDELYFQLYKANTLNDMLKDILIHLSQIA